MLVLATFISFTVDYGVIDGVVDLVYGLVDFGSADGLID